MVKMALRTIPESISAVEASFCRHVRPLVETKMPLANQMSGIPCHIRKTANTFGINLNFQGKSKGQQVKAAPDKGFQYPRGEGIGRHCTSKVGGVQRSLEDHKFLEKEEVPKRVV